MPTMASTKRFKVWTGSYDFAVDTGAQVAYVLRSNHGPLPIGAVIFGGLLDITVSCASAAGGKMELMSEGAGDLLAASLQAALTAGIKDIVPDMSGSTAIKLTAARAPTLTITLQDFTAGAFSLYLFYE